MTADELVETSFVRCDDLHLNIFEMAPSLMRKALAQKSAFTYSPSQLHESEIDTTTKIQRRFSQDNLKRVHEETLEYMRVVTRIEP